MLLTKRHPRFVFSTIANMMTTKKNFLLQHRQTILDGIDHIDRNYYRDDFLTSLNSVGWKCVIVPDSEWCEGKVYPTESSKEHQEVRILNSYARGNFRLCGFWDSDGWTFHELAHAVIFSGLLPQKFLDINSPFSYPLNTDEIYCFGYQMREMLNDGTYGNLMKFYADAGLEDEIGTKLSILKECLF